MSMDMDTFSLGSSLGMGGWSIEMGASRVDVMWTTGGASVFNLWSKGQTVMFVYDAFSNTTNCLTTPSAEVYNASAFDGAVNVLNETVRGLPAQEWYLPGFESDQVDAMFLWTAADGLEQFGWLAATVVEWTAASAQYPLVVDIDYFSLPQQAWPDQSTYFVPPQCNNKATSARSVKAAVPAPHHSLVHAASVLDSIHKAAHA